MLRNLTSARDHELEPLADPTRVSGFASPAADYIQDRLHIAQRLVTDPTNTFYFEMASDELSTSGICKGALLVVDRSVSPKAGSTVVASVEGEWTLRRLDTPAEGAEEELTIFGVVTWSCNPMAEVVKLSID